MLEGVAIAATDAVWAASIIISCCCLRRWLMENYPHVPADKNCNWCGCEDPNCWHWALGHAGGRAGKDGKDHPIPELTQHPKRLNCRSHYRSPMHVTLHLFASRVVARNRQRKRRHHYHHRPHRRRLHGRLQVWRRRRRLEVRRMCFPMAGRNSMGPHCAGQPFERRSGVKVISFGDARQALQGEP